MEAGSDQAPAGKKGYDLFVLRAAAAAFAVAATVRFGPGAVRDMSEAAAPIYDGTHAALESGPGAAQDSRSFSMAELDSMRHKKKITVHKGDGIYTIISRANPHQPIFSDAPALNAEYRYIKRQAPGGVLQPREVIKVPPIKVERPQP